MSSSKYAQSALDAASCLAADYYPVTDRQIEAQTEIYRAIAGRRIADVVDAMTRARRYATLTWRNWETTWRLAVDRYILAGGHRREAA
jgi:hypothetical protein